MGWPIDRVDIVDAFSEHEKTFVIRASRMHEKPRCQKLIALYRDADYILRGS